MTPRILMCEPKYFGIEYEINPWMSVERGIDHGIAVAQWRQLCKTLRSCGTEIVFMEPVDGLPDLVFTANAGTVSNGVFVPSRFKFTERQGEELVFTEWFNKEGFAVAELPSDIRFEGAGDMLKCGDRWFVGYGFRSDARVHAEISSILDSGVVALRLVDPYYYHLDTCFCPLSDGSVIWYPPAFDSYSRKVVETFIPERIEATEREAALFACNAVCVGRHVVMSAGCPHLMRDLCDRGFLIHSVNLGEYMKSGGSAKCLTLLLD